MDIYRSLTNGDIKQIIYLHIVNLLLAYYYHIVINTFLL
nr:MAG TPA: hypothetical protein [Bacteriophage sp.]DAX86539.1 MAG TPA: hypothetical protein [Caudoviricetes sp.]